MRLHTVARNSVPALARKATGDDAPLGEHGLSPIAVAAATNVVSLAPTTDRAFRSAVVPLPPGISAAGGVSEGDEARPIAPTNAEVDQHPLNWPQPVADWATLPMLSRSSGLRALRQFESFTNAIGMTPGPSARASAEPSLPELQRAQAPYAAPFAAHAGFTGPAFQTAIRRTADASAPATTTISQERADTWALPPSYTQPAMPLSQSAEGAGPFAYDTPSAALPINMVRGALGRTPHATEGGNASTRVYAPLAQRAYERPTAAGLALELARPARLPSTESIASIAADMVTVQRQAETSSTDASPAAQTAQPAGTDIEALTQRLYERLRWRLLNDRERMGRI